jgi:hypothetical protein
MKLIEAARQFKGMKENPGNNFDPKSPLGIMLAKAGHKAGEAWCVYFVEGCAYIAFPNREAEIAKLFSANAVQCYRNLVSAGFPVTSYPVPGAIGFMQRYKGGLPQSTGHAFLVDIVNPTGSCLTLEGNSNEHGARETDEGHVAANNRKPGFEPDGLNIIGFVTLPWAA